MTPKDEPPDWKVFHMLLGNSRGQLLIASERMKQLGQSGYAAQLWMCLVVKVKYNAVKNNTAQEPGMLGPWIKVNWKWSNSRWQEWILGISELKWTRIGKFNSDDHYIYYCRQESHQRNGVALTVNKRIWNTVFGYNLKNDRMISVSKANYSTSQ